MVQLKLIPKICFLVIAVGAFTQPAAAKGIGKTDAEIANILIRQSISNYSGSCPCPYNRARNGSKCGKRSAYSRPGGATPLCYRSDVTAAMITRYRKS